MAAPHGTVVLVNYALDMGLERAPRCVHPFLQGDAVPPVPRLQVHITVESCVDEGHHSKIPVLCLEVPLTTQEVTGFSRPIADASQRTASVWVSQCTLQHFPQTPTPLNMTEVMGFPQGVQLVTAAVGCLSLLVNLARSTHHDMACRRLTSGLNTLTTALKRFEGGGGAADVRDAGISQARVHPRVFFRSVPTPEQFPTIGEWLHAASVGPDPHCRPSDLRDLPLAPADLVHLLCRRMHNDLLLAIRHDRQVLWARAASRPSSSDVDVQGTLCTTLFMHQLQRPNGVRSSGKLHVIWIARRRTVHRAVQEAQRSRQRLAPHYIAGLGQLHLIWSTSIDGGRCLVTPPVRQLPGNLGQRGGEDKLLTLTLLDVHDYVFARSALVSWARLTRQSVAPLPAQPGGATDAPEPEPVPADSGAADLVAHGAPLGVEVPGRPSLPGAPLLRMLGVSPSATCAPLAAASWDDVLGTLQARDVFLDELQHAWGVSWYPQQREAFRNIAGNFTALHCIAGAGKTLVCTAVASKCLQQDVPCWVAVPSKSMRAEVECRLRQLHPNVPMVVLGTDQQGQDYYQDFLQAMVRDSMQKPLARLAEVDAYIDGLPEGVPEDIPRWIFSLRHRHMWTQVYVPMVEAWRSLREHRVPLVVTTVGYLLRHLGGFGNWSNWPALASPGALILDEYHQIPDYFVFAVVSAFRLCLLSGDPMQSLARKMQLNRHGNRVGTVDQASTAPASQWVQAAEKVHDGYTVLPMDTSLRWPGSQTLNLLKAIDSDMYGHLRAIAGSQVAGGQFPEAWVVPAIYQVGDWVYAPDDETSSPSDASSSWAAPGVPYGDARGGRVVLCSPTMLRDLALIVWTELHHEVQDWRHCQIAIVCHYRIQLLVVRDYLCRVLPLLPSKFGTWPSSFEIWQQHVQVARHPSGSSSASGTSSPSPEDPDADDAADASSNRSPICLYGPVEAGGITSAVVVALVQKRREHDVGWWGLLTEPALQYIQLSRHSRRLHLLIADHTLPVLAVCKDWPVDQTQTSELYRLWASAAAAWPGSASDLQALRDHAILRGKRLTGCVSHAHAARLQRNRLWLRCVQHCRQHLASVLAISETKDLTDAGTAAHGAPSGTPSTERLPPALVCRGELWDMLRYGHWARAQVAAALPRLQTVDVQQVALLAVRTTYTAQDAVTDCISHDVLVKALALTEAREEREPMPDFRDRYGLVGHLDGLWQPPVARDDEPAAEEPHEPRDADALDPQTAAIKVFDAWEPYVLDAVTAHVKGIGRGLVELPVRWVNDVGYSIDDLICAMARAVYDQVCVWDPERRWGFDVRRHKANTVEVEGELFWHKACWSDRPAFCILECVDVASDTWEERLHWHLAMGCDQQHRQIQTTLARVQKSPVILTAVLACIPCFFPSVRLYRELLLIEVPEEQKRGGTPAQVTAALERHLHNCGAELESEFQHTTLTRLLDLIGHQEPGATLSTKVMFALHTYRVAMQRRRSAMRPMEFGCRARPGAWRYIDPKYVWE